MPRPAATPALAVFLILVATSLTPPANAGLNSTGRWTSKYDSGATWDYIPVHLVLTRGTGPYHSQILWYNSHNEGVLGQDFFGGVWGWKADSTTSDADCSQYPGTRFTALSFGEPEHNIFCTGHTVLANGKVLIAGGSELETGVTRSTIFDPVTRAFTAQEEMAEARWYPTATTLPDGTALVTSGSTFTDAWCIGGQSAPGSGNTVTDSLQLFSQTQSGGWGTPVKDLSLSSEWPSARYGHAAVFNVHTSNLTIFGGTDAVPFGTMYQDTWFLYRGPDTDEGPHYKAFDIDAASPPSARYRHSMVSPGDSTLIVFGGRSTLFADANTYELYKNGDDWTWRLLDPTSPPSARQGHTAVWDPENECMLVFGGTGTSGYGDASPTDTLVHKLALGASPAWSVVTVDPDSTFGYPPARHGHGMVWDFNDRYVQYEGAPDDDHEHRLLLFGGMGSTGLLNDFWVLWVPNAGSGAHYIWEKVEPPGTPPSPRYRFSMFYDAAFDRLDIIGGTVVNDSATATAYSIPLVHLTSTNDLSWQALPVSAIGPVTGQTITRGAFSNWAFGQEIFDPATAEWTVQNSRKRQDWYPFGFVAPQTDSVRVFYAGPDTQSYYYNLSASTNRWRPFPATSTPTFRGGSAVMYQPGKIMRCGSRDTDAQNSQAVGTTQTLDLLASPAPSAWSTGAAMSARVNHNLVVLPGGQVLVTGGMTQVSNAENIGPVFRPQLWNPTNGVWTSMTEADTLSADSTMRGYHSNAILLPDGRVLTVSGNPNEDNHEGQAGLDSRRATIYCPPYLFDANGNLKTRAEISAPESASYGSSFEVCVDNIGTAPIVSKVCLIRPAASTHGFNMDQRYIPLTFQSQCSRRTLSVTAPANSSIAPPGDYMLFAVRNDSIPSIAEWIRIGPGDDPFPPECACSGGGAMMAGGGEESGTGEGETGSAPENALLPEASQERLYRLKAGLEADSTLVVRVVQESGGTTAIDQANLDAYDYPAGLSIFAAGDHAVLGTLSPVPTIETARGACGALAGKIDAESIQMIEEGDTLTVDFNADTKTESSHTMVVEARSGTRDVFGEASALLTVLVPDTTGGERALTTKHVRRDFDEIVVEDCPAHTRFALTPGTQVRLLAELMPVDSLAGPTELKLSSAELSGSGSAKSAVESEGGSATTLAAGDVLALRWSKLAPVAVGKARSYFLRVASTTSSSEAGSESSSRMSRLAPTFVFALRPARPNPFADRTTIDYSLAVAGKASLQLYDVAGRLVRTLVRGSHPAGPASVVWDGRSDGGTRLGAGVYFARLESGAKKSNMKLVILGR